MKGARFKQIKFFNLKSITLPKLMKFRLFLIISSFACLYSSLIYHVYDLQIVKGSYYTARAFPEPVIRISDASARRDLFFR